MATDTNNTPPGLDEKYLVATTTSNLRLHPDRTCAATHLIAAGLLGNRMGQALSHLRSEWDAADKPRKATEDEILARAGELPKRKGKMDVKRARTELLVGYAVAMRHRAHSLIGWLPALSIMGEWALLRGVDVDLLSPALYHWLAPTCPVCDGHGVRKGLYGAGEREPKCFHCNGLREPGQSEGPTIWPRPLGADRIHDWLKACVGKAKGDRGGFIRGEIDAGDVKEAKERQRERARQLAAMERQETDPEAVAAQFRKGMERVEREPREKQQTTTG